MTTSKIAEWRSEAAAVMEQIRKLEAQLVPLRNRHSELAGLIEAESRRLATIRKMPYNASGKRAKSPRNINTTELAKQFTNLPAGVQAELLKKLEQDLRKGA